MTDTSKAEKTRSPRYPQFSLGDALLKIKEVYKKEARHKVPKEAVVKSLNYTSINGASLGALSTLKQYGLLETIGEGLRVSDDAVTILELPKGNAERVEVILKAAFSPKLFAQLKEEYGEGLPSDESVRLNLLRKGYKKPAADVIIRTFRETLALAAEEKGDYNAAGTPVQRQKQEEELSMPTEAPVSHGKSSINQPPLQNFSPSASGESILAFKLSRDTEARVIFSGKVTQEAIDKLAALLDLSKDAYPTKAEIQTTDYVKDE